MRFLKSTLPLFVVSVLTLSVSAQKRFAADTLALKLKGAKTTEQKIDVYYKYAGDFFMYDPRLSDSLAFAGSTLAEISRDRRLIVQTMLRNADRYMENFSKKSNITEAMALIQKALTLSKSVNDPAVTLACYNKLARCYRGIGEPDKALQANSEAISLLPEITDDSLKVVTYNNYGYNLFEKDDMLGCFKEYLNALTIAEQSKRKHLINLCYEALSEFYKSLRDFEKSKDYAFKILNADNTSRNADEVAEDYYRIAAIYVAAKDNRMALMYFNKADHVADSSHLAMYRLQVKLGIINMYLNSNHFTEGYELLRNSPEIFSVMNSSGMHYEIDKANAYIQMKLGHTDSSLYYYKKAEPFYAAGNAFDRFSFYNQYSLLFYQLKKWDQAIEMELKAKEAIEHTGHIEMVARLLENLDSLYYFKGDFKTAYQYHAQWQLYKDSLQKLSKEKDLQSLEIDNENKRAERANLIAAEELDRRHNLQYLAITVAIGGIFILLVVLGLLKVSPAVVKAMGFFAFIFLFEFIILIADNQIHHLTHGEPWKVLAIKIGLIAMLLPFHHWLEEKVVHLLITNRLKVAERIQKLRGTPKSDISSGASPE